MPGMARLCATSLLLASAIAALCAGSALAAPPPNPSGIPSVSAVAPSQGSVLGGEQVTIDGSGFSGPDGACASDYNVWFGNDQYGVPASSFRVVSDTQIVATVPPNSGGGVNVQVHNSCGTSPETARDWFNYTYPTSQCLTGTCSVSIGSAAGRPLRHAGLGFLDGFDTDAGDTITPRDVRLVDALHPLTWRFGAAWLGAPSGGIFSLAKNSGAQVNVDLTSDWEDWDYNVDQETDGEPYGALSTYYSFIYNDVEQRIAAGEMPNYFDVWNEPGPWGTVAQWLSVYQTGYDAIKAADPSAQIEGPSISWFLTRSPGNTNQSGFDLSLRDFLNWEMRSGTRFAAISWHEDGTTLYDSPAGAGLPSELVPGGKVDYWSPAAIAAHVAVAKALLAHYPALAGTKIFVNEYGPVYADNIPGWMVGDFWALESSGATAGMLTCPTDSGCTSLLDGLLGPDGQPQMPYWVMKAYSQMGGSMLTAKASGSNLYTLATRVARSRTVDALIGRADDCFGGVQCPQYHTSPAAPIRLAVSVAIPRSVRAVRITLNPLPDSATNPIGDNDVPSAPTGHTLAPACVKNGHVDFDLPQVYDGDAMYVIVAPASQASCPGTSGGQGVGGNQNGSSGWGRPHHRHTGRHISGGSWGTRLS